MYIWKCIHVCFHRCIHRCIHIHECIHRCIHVHIHVHMDIYMDMDMYMRMCMYVDMRIWAHLYTYTCDNIRIYTLNKHIFIIYMGFPCKANGKPVCNMQVCLKHMTGTKKNKTNKKNNILGVSPPPPGETPRILFLFGFCCFFGPGQAF